MMRWGLGEHALDEFGEHGFSCGFQCGSDGEVRGGVDVAEVVDAFHLDIVVDARASHGTAKTRTESKTFRLV